MNTAKFAFENPTKVYVEKTIRLKGEKKLQAIQHPYADSEAKTWDIQLSEATAFTLSSTAEVPLITALATARNLTKEVLVTKIMENANAFRTASGSILGQQQKFLDDLAVTTDLKAFLNTVLAW